MSEFLQPESYKSPEQLAQQELSKFVQNPGLDELAKLYGIAELPADIYDRLSTLRIIADVNWDFRQGAERQDVNWNHELVEEDSDAWNAVFAAADKLGMVKSGELKNKNPKYLSILGGANKSPYDRLRFGLESTENFEHVVYLGSSRKVSVAEHEKAKEYAPDAATEFDLGSGAFEKLLNARLVDEINEVRHGDTWGMRLYEFERNGETKSGFVLSTPQEIHTGKNQTRRATTYDNYKFFADRAELSDDPEATVAAISTGFYVPGQHLPGAQMLTLPHGNILETIGHSADYSGAKRVPAQLLQEIKAAIDAAVRLQAAINLKTN